jgi:hypothetical protein
MQIFRRFASLFHRRRAWTLESPENCVDLHERLAAY